MDSDDENVVCAAAAFVYLSGQFVLMKRRRKRRWWMTSLYKSRGRYNATDMLCDLRKEPSGKFENFCRMSAADFEHLLQRITPAISKKNTNMRECIPIQERLAVTLRFLASGDSFVSLSYLFKFSRQTVSNCVMEVCRALIDTLNDEIKLPATQNQWLDIANAFQMQWNFPNCIGALDGKHIVLQCPLNTGSEFFNYEGTFSVSLMALVNANYCFTFVDVGCQGRISDGGVFKNSSLYSKLQNEELNLPADSCLPSSNIVVPYVVVGDSAFALSKRLMKPYPGVYESGSKERVYNYRLCRARRVVENAFGILASVFRVFRKPMLLEPESVNIITLTCVLLHNYMRNSTTSAVLYTPPGTLDFEEEGELRPGSWRNDQSEMTPFLSLNKTPRKPGEIAKVIRTSFAHYFSTSGKLSWQHKYC